MAEEDPRLPAGAEALLQGLPLPEPDFEALASRVDARVATTIPGSTDDALLAAPFPDEAGEEVPAPAQPAAPRLSDLARAVAQKRTDAADTELAREALSAASKLRSQTDVLVERMRAAPKAAEPPLRPAAAEAVPARPMPPPPVLPRSEASAASAPPPARTEKEKKSSLTAIWGGAGLVLAAAAAWVVLVGSPKTPEATRADTAVAAAPAASAVAQAEAPKEMEHPLPPVAVAERTPAPAAEPAAPEPVAIAKGGASRGADSEGSSAASSPVVARPKKSSARPEKVELDAAPGKPAAQAPAGPSNQDAQLKPAAGEPAEDLMPDKPSTGAVQAAIASVMGSARSCVAGADGPTPATVIFGSNGSVKSVVIGGAVEGTPAAKCISSALSRAKVAPFAQSSFSVGVSVRP
jgi:hypothetical protein